MSESVPRVSVLMPVYNGERFLAETIEAVLRQTLQDFELVIVNDGSTDGSPKILDRYAAMDARIRVIHQSNGGISRALNAAISAARANYIAPLDQDDISLPHRLEAEARALDADPSLVCVGGWYELIDGKGRYLTTVTLPVSHEEIDGDALRGHCGICHPGCMMRCDAVLSVGGYDPEFDLTQDLDLFLRLAEVGRLGNLPLPVLRYRVHAKSSSEQRGVEQRARGRAACERAWQRRGIAGEFTADRPWRPGPTRASLHQYLLMYGWWAFQSGERRTAAIYGVRSIATLPRNIGGWKLLACSIAKPAPRKQRSRTIVLSLPEGSGASPATASSSPAAHPPGDAHSPGTSS